MIDLCAQGNGDAAGYFDVSAGDAPPADRILTGERLKRLRCRAGMLSVADQRLAVVKRHGEPNRG